MRYYYPYSEYLSDCKELTKLIQYDFDAIIAIARGGMTMAHMMGEHYDMREVYTINTIGYIDDKKLEKTEVFNIPDIKNAKHVLVVDDIVDSGDTMKLVLETMSERYPNCEFKSASLFYKKTAVMKPDWYVHIADKWIDFFWSVDLQPAP
jgi:xanthine phosphoribosyltransferase